MKFALLAAAAASSLFATAASAQVVYNTTLQNQGGTVGTPGANGVVVPSTRTTTTDATGTRTTVSANPGAANTGANRGIGTGVTNSWYQTNIGMGSTVGITTDHARSGNGSAYFRQTQANNGKGDLQYYLGDNATGALAPIALSTLSSFSYDYFRSSTSTNDPIQAPVLRLDVLLNGADAGALIFEPYYNTNANAAVDTWTTLGGTLTSGKWWSNNAALGGAPQTVFQSLQAWIDGNRGSTISVYGIELGFGSGWQGIFDGAADNVSVNFASRSINANFEVVPTAAAVPEPATWGLMMLGFGAAGFGLRRRGKATRALRTA